MSIYQLKIKSVHPSSAKLICPNSWVLESGPSVYLISLVVSSYGTPQAPIAAIFRQSAGYVFYLTKLIFLQAFETIKQP